MLLEPPTHERIHVGGGEGAKTAEQGGHASISPSTAGEAPPKTQECAPEFQRAGRKTPLATATCRRERFVSTSKCDAEVPPCQEQTEQALLRLVSHTRGASMAPLSSDSHQNIHGTWISRERQDKTSPIPDCQAETCWC